jgi:hypothetical protein
VHVLPEDWELEGIHFYFLREFVANPLFGSTHGTMTGSVHMIICASDYEVRCKCSETCLKRNLGITEHVFSEKVV